MADHYLRVALMSEIPEPKRRKTRSQMNWKTCHRQPMPLQNIVLLLN